MNFDNSAMESARSDFDAARDAMLDKWRAAIKAKAFPEEEARTIALGTMAAMATAFFSGRDAR